ncbi:hypothetical protein BRI6_4803 [plant metagenome]|uniref:Uncharacterized protein n=1 Tax=plant metagenome TaxID=1297885 RepID=A0A484SDM0_9ZZZZ
MAAPCPGAARGWHPDARRRRARRKAGHPGRRATALPRGAVLRRPAAVGRVSARFAVPAAGGRAVGRGVLRAHAAGHRGARAGVAGAGPGRIGERAAGLLRRVGPGPLGRAALRPGRSQLRRLPGHAAQLHPVPRAGHRLHRVLLEVLCPSSARRVQAGRLVRGHRGDPPALARADTAGAHGRVPALGGPGQPARPDARAGVEHRLRPAAWRPGQRGHPGTATGRGPDPRLAAAVVQPASDAAGSGRRGPRALLPARRLSGHVRGRRDRAGERAGFQPAAVLRSAALGRGARGLVLRRHAAPRADHRPAAHAARHRAPDRRDPQGRRGQHAVRPDAGGHGDVPDPGRHPAGRARSPSQPPGEEGRRRDPGIGAGAQGRAAGALADRQRPQALPRHAGVLPARPRRGRAGPPRAAARERHAQCRAAAGAGRGRGRSPQQLSALAALRVPPQPGPPAVVQPADVRPARSEPVASVGSQPGHGASGHHLLQPRRRGHHVRPVPQAGPADERPPIPVRPDRLGQVRHAQQHPQPGRGDLPPAHVHRRGR